MATLLELTLASSYASQVLINRWNYVGSGTPASVTLSFALASAFGAIYDQVAVPPAYPPNTVMAAISALVHQDTTFQSLEVRAIYSPTDFYTTGFNPAYTGQSGDNSMPPFVGYGFRTNRVRADIRRGTKRFGAVSEGLVTSGGTITSQGLDLMNTLRIRMGTVLTYDDEGNTISFAPAVVKKQRYVVNPTDPVAEQRTAYRYIPVADGGEVAQLDDTALGIAWETYNQARSQTSRQYGRGG